MKRQLFLASASPRRQALLRDQNISFTLVPNQLHSEPVIRAKTLHADTEECAYLKADASKETFDGLIMAVDTCVCLDDTVLGKPTTLQEAQAYIAHLSGHTHQVVSAVCIIDSSDNSMWRCSETTLVTFRDLTTEEINSYTQTHAVTDKAGGYGIQDIPADWISKLNGNYDNVLGLPLQAVLKQLANYDIVEATK